MASQLILVLFFFMTVGVSLQSSIGSCTLGYGFLCLGTELLCLPRKEASEDQRVGHRHTDGQHAGDGSHEDGSEAVCYEPFLVCPKIEQHPFVTLHGDEGKHVEEREVEAIAHWQCPGVEHMKVKSVYRKDCDHPQPNSLAVGHTYGQPFEVSCLA